VDDEQRTKREAARAGTGEGCERAPSVPGGEGDAAARGTGRGKRILETRDLQFFNFLDAARAERT